MKKQAFNPYLPSDEYIPDGEPYVFGDRVYVYGSHDQFNGKAFCENDYVTWSAPIDDLASWRYEGIIYKKNQDPHNKTGKKNMFAPDIAKGPDGQYYLYYTLGFSGVMSVAKSETPTGPFEFYGHVKYPDGNIVGKQTGDVFQFDPGIFVDDERVYLYSGFAPKKTSPLRLLSKGRRMLVRMFLS
ncbi:family 43 glycosylhydrolase [Halolactibacillus sp. JCM 19043]|uniref:family 43 glycosylhydrolase n=1 Tax=Halolactibacillus sp. JCM 19043 TaxID=1460638 RepID=UPI0009E96184|nr:family 43 glycosylhydrolase [Halolactibacillus sp. JCM 19043]